MSFSVLDWGATKGHPTPFPVVLFEQDAERPRAHGPVRVRHTSHKQISTPLQADRPERPTIILDWSLEHPLGMIKHKVLLLDFMASRSGWHRNRGVCVCVLSQTSPFYRVTSRRCATSAWMARSSSSSSTWVRTTATSRLRRTPEGKRGDLWPRCPEYGRFSKVHVLTFASRP